MSPTNEQIMAEVRRRTPAVFGKELEDTIIEVMREGWKPPEPEPVDPDILAFREFAAQKTKSASLAKAYLDGDLDSSASARLFLAGARMAREQERERAKVLVSRLSDLILRVEEDWALGDVTGINASEMISARQALAKYRGEA